MLLWLWSLRAQGRRGECGALWFETALARLLTMRVWLRAACEDLILRSPQQAGVSKDGPLKERRHESSFPRRDASEFFNQITLMRSEGAGKTGCPSHPWSACRKKHAAEPQVRAGTTGLPCAMVLRLIRDLPGDQALFVTVASHHPRNLTPALGRQDHTISPSAPCCSSHNTPRPSHPTPNVRDDRETPLVWVRDAREHGFDLPDGATEKCTTGNLRRASMRIPRAPPSLRAQAKQSRLPPRRKSGLLPRYRSSQ